MGHVAVYVTEEVNSAFWFGKAQRIHPVPSYSGSIRSSKQHKMYTRVNKNPSAWNFLSPKPVVTCGTVAIIIRVVLLSPYLRIRADVRLSTPDDGQKGCPKHVES